MIILEIDETPRTFGIIAGGRMTRVAASPIAEVMEKLESPEVDMDWFPIGMGEEKLHFAICIDDIKLWVECLGDDANNSLEEGDR